MKKWAGLCGLLALGSCENGPVFDRPVDVATEITHVESGAVLRVGRRRICGFTLDQPVYLDGRGATIVACDGSPEPVAGLKAGILVNAGAAGSVIEGFRFEGGGVTSGATDALAFGVFARGADRVIVRENHFQGTVQAITDVGGASWLIERNDVDALEVFGCPGPCGGGDGIVVAHSRTDGTSADDVLVVDNEVHALAPPADLPFSVDGVVALSVLRPTILENRIRLRAEPTIGIEYTRTAGGVLLDFPCGGGRILGNHVRAQQDILVTDDCAMGTTVADRPTSATPLLLTARVAHPLGLD